MDDIEVLRTLSFWRFDDIEDIEDIDGWWKLTVLGNWRFVFCMISNPELTSWKSTFIFQIILQLDRGFYELMKSSRNCSNMTLLIRHQSHESPDPLPITTTILSILWGNVMFVCLINMWKPVKNMQVYVTHVLIDTKSIRVGE